MKTMSVGVYRGIGVAILSAMVTIGDAYANPTNETIWQIESRGSGECLRYEGSYSYRLGPCDDNANDQKFLINYYPSSGDITPQGSSAFWATVRPASASQLYMRIAHRNYAVPCAFALSMKPRHCTTAARCQSSQQRAVSGDAEPGSND